MFAPACQLRIICLLWWSLKDSFVAYQLGYHMKLRVISFLLYDV